MAIRGHVDHKRGLVLLIAGESITEDDFSLSLDYEAWSDSHVVRYPVLLDLRRVLRIESSQATLREFAWRTHVHEKNRRGRIAVVVRHQSVLGMARAFQNIREAQPDNTVEIRVLTDTSEARRWLGIQGARPGGEA
ncbi:MAG: hypothetical protein JXO72_04400 [Vicinamibacteria bacterium]|nr:hypothetical protein [Vicinamibacteria bacterium]